MMRRLRTLPLVLLTIWSTALTVAGFGHAQTSAPESEKEKLEQDFTDPLTTLRKKC